MEMLRILLSGHINGKHTGDPASGDQQPKVMAPRVCPAHPQAWGSSAPSISTAHLVAMVRHSCRRGFVPHLQGKEGIELSLCFGVECSVLDASLLLLLAVADGLSLFEILLADTGGADLPPLPLLSMGFQSSMVWEGAGLQARGCVEEEDTRQQARCPAGLLETRLCVLILLPRHRLSSSACNTVRRLIHPFD